MSCFSLRAAASGRRAYFDGFAFSLVAAAAILFGGLVQVGRADERATTEAFPDGTPHKVYTLDADGHRNGAFKEFFPDGKPRVQATYRGGDYNGPFKSYFPSGKPKLIATYADGLLNGKYVEYADDGRIVVTANYRDGVLHGPRQEYENGAQIGDEIWIDGRLVIPKSPQRIAADLAAIQRLPVRTVGEFPKMPDAVASAVKSSSLLAENEAAVRQLMAYRYLCDVPFDDLAIDRTYLAHAQAGAQILMKIGKLTHTPENPGMPEDDYKFAYKGTSSSNIFSSSGGIAAAGTVGGYMDDSDKGNIDRLGHRRWCLNPAMAKTGFGVDQHYSAMWSFDGSRKDVPDYNFVAFPPRGLTPTSMFKDHYAWNVTLNPQRYKPADEKQVKVTVTPLALQRGGSLEKVGPPLDLNFFKVNLDGYGVPNCVIFRPEGIKVAADSMYWVEIKGLKTKTDHETLIDYLVAFFNLGS